MAEDFRRDVTQHMYLEDIRKRDIDNLQLVQKDLKEHWFDKEDVAMHFMGHIVNRILMKFGVDQLSMMKKFPGRTQVKLLTKLIDKEMKKADVKVERRRYSGEDFYRSGIYFYHHNEIAYWVSEPLMIRGGKSRSNGLILPSNIQYMVRTNYKY